MFNIDKNNIISITRGDSASAPLFLNQGTETMPMRYNMNDKDEIYFAIMSPNEYFEEATRKKKYTKDNLDEYGDIVIEFEHEDTVELVPGKYFYQLKLKQYISDDKYKVDTIIKKTELFIME